MSACRSSVSDKLIRAALRLAGETSCLRFRAPVTHVYNPLAYAWGVHEAYLRRYGSTPKRVIFLGMNPGPFGMSQTGVPFGEVSAVRDWLRLEGEISRPEREHPRRLVLGFDCSKSEVSGRRLWGLFAQRFGAADTFFSEHIVLNYCPLTFMEESGRNRTPDKLPRNERLRLFGICDAHLRAAVAALEPEWVVGVGGFAAERARVVLEETGIKLGRIPHPSPASPAANRDWAGLATRRLIELGIWKQGRRVAEPHGKS